MLKASEPKYNVGDVVYFIAEGEIRSDQVEDVMEARNTQYGLLEQVRVYYPWQLFPSVDALLASLKSRFEEKK